MNDKYCECEYCSSQGELSECWALIKIAALEADVASLRINQQLKAEIAAAVDAFQGDGIWMKDSDIVNAFCAKLRQLSAV